MSRQRQTAFDKPVPSTPEDWCRVWHELDVTFGTAPHSPLHHDARCALCRARALANEQTGDHS